jgi:predicted O-methyltransferase YrrM
MPIRPTFLENLLFLKLNQGPAPLFDLFGAGAFRAVAIGIKLGLFETIGSSALTLEEISSRLACNSRALGILIEFLCSLGYLQRKSGKYENTALTKKWIVRDSQVSFSDMVSVWEKEVFPFWDRNVENVLKTGVPKSSLYQEFEAKPEAWQSFNSFEMAIANWLKGTMLSQIKLPPRTRRLLDVGGGHGLYSIAFCQRYPQLTATVFDREQPLKIARANIDSSALQDRIRLQNGDFLTDDLGEGYDVAFLFNIIHNFGKAKNVEIIRKINKALAPDGSIVIFDNISGPGIAKRTIDFFSLAYLVTVGGQCYTLKQLKGWLMEAGFANPKTTIRLPGLVRATKAP